MKTIGALFALMFMVTICLFTGVVNASCTSPPEQGINYNASEAISLNVIMEITAPADLGTNYLLYTSVCADQPPGNVSIEGTYYSAPERQVSVQSTERLWISTRSYKTARWYGRCDASRDEIGYTIEQWKT